MTASFVPLSFARMHQAKAAYATRHANLSDAVMLVAGNGVRPQAGDLVLARVVSIGHHQKLELAHGRRSALFVGDEIVVAYGNRYAPDQFEAEVPDSLIESDLVAAGGIASSVISRHDLTRKATRIAPIGLLVDANSQVINLIRYAMPIAETPKTALTLAVLGASMNAGKTTTAVALVRGLKAAGYKVGAAKVTGTGAGGDLWQLVDAGASPALDFTSAGHASTYRASDEQLDTIFRTLTRQLMAAGCDAIVLEVADGVYQQETAYVAQSDQFRETVDGVVFAVRDAMSAVSAVEWIDSRGLNLLAITGAISQSPLAMQEAMDVTARPMFTVDDLHKPESIAELIEPLTQTLRKFA